MSASEDETGYPLVMPMADWLVVDAVMDLEIQDLRDKAWESGTPDQLDEHASGLADVAESIRQAGWHQIPDLPQDASGFESWPKPGQTANLSLTARQWGLVVSALRRWAAVDEPSEPQDAAACRRIAAMLREQFIEKRYGEIPPVRTEW
ncbi:hypothetical protein [Actinoplanes teichomyceticus]|uniref:Uncharacterized protein n=1 Tax=Actinoplanes teichomyceticus TaxID=1867 RepID=A0A561VLR8_ACTTI|nr:hypothetical protein [Actinoplanes teichomyceticus]TWG12554.1 hypothetical protein FHX34_105421 [Actinoplanes teichomyceticus]GIF13920.1 hypothetical protein Ate01nite_39520 [Actinoplanes teichomyceticus]